MLDRKVNEGGRGCESVLVRDFWKSSGKIVGCCMLGFGGWCLETGVWIRYLIDWKEVLD